MRKMPIIAAAILCAAAFMPAPSKAITTTTPAGLATAAKDLAATQDVFYRCRWGRCWGGYHRYGYYGWHRRYWGWHRPVYRGWHRRYWGWHRPYYWGWHRRHYWGWHRPWGWHRWHRRGWY